MNTFVYLQEMNIEAHEIHKTAKGKQLGNMCNTLAYTFPFLLDFPNEKKKFKMHKLCYSYHGYIQYIQYLILQLQNISHCSLSIYIVINKLIPYVCDCIPEVPVIKILTRYV